MQSAHAAGVRMVTHLFNAMPAFSPREPGIVGVLGSTLDPPLFFGLIADGVHVHPASVKLAAAARPDGVVLVTDGIVAMGLPEGEYYFGEGKVHVVEGGRAYKAGTTTLAGAVVTLDECVRRFRAMTGASVVAALEAASLHPAQAIGISGKKGALEVGADADVVLVDDALHVHATYIGGERVWSRAMLMRRARPSRRPRYGPQWPGRQMGRRMGMAARIRHRHCSILGLALAPTLRAVRRKRRVDNTRASASSASTVLARGHLGDGFVNASSPARGARGRGKGFTNYGTIICNCSEPLAVANANDNRYGIF